MLLAAPVLGRQRRTVDVSVARTADSRRRRRWRRVRVDACHTRPSETTLCTEKEVGRVAGGGRAGAREEREREREREREGGQGREGGREREMPVTWFSTSLGGPLVAIMAQL